MVFDQRIIKESEFVYPLTVSFREGSTTIELGQDDSRYIDVVLLGAGVGLDLTLSTVKIVMNNDKNKTL